MLQGHDDTWLQSHDNRAACRQSTRLLLSRLLIELRFPFRQQIAFASHPQVESREKEDAHDQIGNEAADDHDRETT